MARIIIVEDDLGQQEELLSLLLHTGHEVRAVSDGIALEQCLAQFLPEIVLLDYNLPGESGVVIAAHLRERFGARVGLVMLTARNMGADRVAGRRAGADDYLVKPVDFFELLALIDNLYLRLVPQIAIRTEAWRLLPERSELVPPGASTPIPLTGWELLLLQAIAAAQNQQIDRDELIRALGKNPMAYDPRALEANISRLRRKIPALEDDRSPLQAIRGMGYRFIRPLTVLQ
ncbi:MAG: response regulator transcription factor [Gammaproteobacteria bacterium]|nr:response regulator transcription factor [Gammaproteobacteria bacterium]MBU1775509.1 response regulator transcription factor [Gammaproteobacteria bacterium]MBU1968876.1 response regulator transcription factor [Gammaproteobacteria bacterium]